MDIGGRIKVLAPRDMSDVLQSVILEFRETERRVADAYAINLLVASSRVLCTTESLNSDHLLMLPRAQIRESSSLSLSNTFGFS